MKNLFTLLLALIPVLMFGQKVEGLVQYEQTINMHRQFKGNEEMKQYLPEFRTSKMELLVQGQALLYRAAAEEEDVTHESGDGNIRMSFKRAESIVYKDLKAKEQLTSTEFMGRQFLISDELKPTAWKMTAESKSILGYPCTKAIFQDTADVVEAWFTLSIPVGAGPASYDGLPGLILEVNKNDGEVVFKATNIDLKPLEAGTIEKPDKGKKVTKEEYDAIVAEKMKEMGATGSGGRMMIIRN